MDAAYSVYREILIWDNKNRRAQIIKKQKRTLATAIALLTVLTVAVVIMGTTITPKACSESPRIKYYTTHIVSPSDSLYDISQQYISGEYAGTDEYINEICNINHLEDADSIHTGDQIIVPYYSSEFKQ